MTQWNFGDSFDLCASLSDFSLGYWENPVNVGGFNLGVAGGGNQGRFGGNTVLMASSACSMEKNSGVNNQIHHIVTVFDQTYAPLSGGTSFYFSFYDGATPQCSICFDTMGVITFRLGGPAGTILATYDYGLITSTWIGFEFEVVIHNTVGAFRARKNGAGADSFAATGLNTRATANNYASMMRWGGGGFGSFFQYLDQIFWRSDVSGVAWMGDLRPYIRFPAVDVQAQFTRLPTGVTDYISYTTNWTGNATGNVVRAAGPYKSAASGTLTAMMNVFATPYTGKTRMAIYADDGAGKPGNLIAETVEVLNPNGAAGNTTFTTYPVVGSPQLVKGVNYWLALWTDGTVVTTGNAPGACYALTQTYSSTAFPASMAGGTSVGGIFAGNWGVVIATNNSSAVSEPQEDRLNSYVFDANVGDADFYQFAPLPVNPVAVIATTLRAFMVKSDTGTRSASIQMLSGPTLVATPSLALNTTWQWNWRCDGVDPNTGAVWTPGAVDALQIGPKVVS